MPRFAMYIDLALLCDGQECRKCKGKCMRTWPDGFQVVQPNGPAVRKGKAQLLTEATRQGWEICFDDEAKAFCPDCAKQRARAAANAARGK